MIHSEIKRGITLIKFLKLLFDLLNLCRRLLRDVSDSQVVPNSCNNSCQTNQDDTRGPY